jgi:IstB-like ATP binding protein
MTSDTAAQIACPGCRPKSPASADTPIVIGEAGCIPFEPEAASLFFELISAGYETAIVAVTSSKPFSSWVSDRRESLRISAGLSRGKGLLSRLLPGFDLGRLRTACLPPPSPEKAAAGTRPLRREPASGLPGPPAREQAELRYSPGSPIAGTRLA